SSDENTQSAPTASRNSSSAAAKSRSLMPGGRTAILELLSNRRPRRNDPRIELRRLAEVRGEPGVRRTRVSCRRAAADDQRVGKRGWPASSGESERVGEARMAAADDAVRRVGRVLGLEDDSEIVLPREPLEQEEGRPLGEAGNRRGCVPPTRQQ